MSSTQLIFMHQFPILLFVVAAVVITLFYIFSRELISAIPILYNKMRILYGYIGLIFIVISFIYSSYYLRIFSIRELNVGTFIISPFNAVVFTILTIANFIFTLNSIQQCENVSDNNPLPFLGIIGIQIAIFSLSFSTTIISIYMGLLILMIGGLMFLIPTFFSRDDKDRDKILKVVKSDFLYLILIFIGFAAHFVEYNSANIFLVQPNHSFFAVLSFSFILGANLLLIGLWPLHSPYFRSLSTHFPSYPFLFIIIRRLVGFTFTLKYIISFTATPFKEVLVGLFYTIGLLNLLFGAISSITERKLQELFVQLSLFHMGVIFVVLGETIKALNEPEFSSATFALTYNLAAYALIFTFAFSALNNFIYKFKTDQIQRTIGAGRKDLASSLMIFFSLLFATVFPLTVGFFVQNAMIMLFIKASKIFIILILLFALSLVLVPFIKFTQHTFMERAKQEEKEESFVELGVNMAVLFSFIMIVGTTILSGIIFPFFNAVGLFFPFY